ncbi:MAG: hypothetical protein ACFE96_12305 [Candidatus Hermodarchaeota archaeon]
MKKERLNKKFLDEFYNYDFSKLKENKIFLVGSIRFKDYFIKIESILQIIYSKLVGICSVDGLLNKNKFNEKEWDKLQEIAFRKLEEQEAILVIDVDDYIGEQSKEEIEYFSSRLHKPVYYLSKLKSV